MALEAIIGSEAKALGVFASVVVLGAFGLGKICSYFVKYNNSDKKEVTYGEEQKYDLKPYMAMNI